MNHSSQRYRRIYESISIRHVWLLMPLALSFILLCITPLKEGDLWWNLKLGEQILANHRIPEVDTFSFITAGQPYYYTRYWLSDALLGLISLAGGRSALVISQAVIGVIIAGSLLRESMLRGVPAPVATFFVLFGWIGLYPFISIRPQTFSFLVFALLYWVLSEYLFGRHNYLWLLPILMIVWVNLHGSWAMGLLLLLVSTIFLAVTKFVTVSPVVAIKPLAGWSLATLVAVLINPDGIQVYRSVIATSSNPIVQTYVSEWQPLVITNVLSWAFFALLAVWAIGLAYSQKRPRLHELVLVIVLAAVALRYLRMLPFFLIVATPIVAELFARIDWTLLQSRLGRLTSAGIPTRGAATRINLIFLLAMSTGIVASLPPVWLTVTGKPESSLISSFFPVEAAEFIAATAKPGARLYNLPEWGGYLIWRLNPQALVFTDGRVELYSTAVWEDYIRIAEANTPQDLALLDQYQVDYLVLSKARQARLILASAEIGWRCIHEDSTALVLARSSLPATNENTCPSLPK
jgi:hypothetical protein